MDKEITERPLSISSRSCRDNVILVDYEKKTALKDGLPFEAYTWLVNHLSREGDTVIDINSSSGSACGAALKGGRNAVWISTAPKEQHNTLQSAIQNMFSLDSDKNDDSQTSENVISQDDD